jgi:hypothetical protein
LDGIAADSTEAIHDDVAPTALGDVFSDLFRGDREPGLVVKADAVVELGEEAVALLPVLGQLGVDG